MVFTIFIFLLVINLDLTIQKGPVVPFRPECVLVKVLTWANTGDDRSSGI